MKERQTILALKRFKNQSVAEYAGYLQTVLENVGLDIIEMVWSPEKESYVCIIKRDMAVELVTTFLTNEIIFICKKEYMEITSNQHARFLI
jgi:hypothetical protein